MILDIFERMKQQEEIEEVKVLTPCELKQQTQLINEAVKNQYEKVVEQLSKVWYDNDKK